MSIVGRRKIWYIISLAIIVPGTISLVMSGLKLGIDFKGGSMMEVSGQVSQTEIKPIADKLKLKDLTVISSGNDHSLIRYLDESPAAEQEANHQKLKDALAKEGKPEVRFESVGPSVSRDIARNAVVSVFLASIAIVLYVWFAFRNTPPPVSPLSFGLVTIAALLHDALLVLGIFSLLGQFFGVEIDALFVTAILTAIGFSVHDTIVVFDRIRENLRRDRGEFEYVVNRSIIETLARSLNTSMTVLITLLALYLFGGTTIQLFVLALLIGIAAGTYSSIFNAAPLLVTVHNRRLKRARAASKSA